MYPLKITAALLVAASAVVATSHTATAELLNNPGFEDTDSNGNYGDGWGSFGAAGFNAFFGAANGHASLFADQAANSGGIFQQGIPATPGVEYAFSLSDTLIENDFSGDLSFGLEFYAADDGTKVGETFVVINDRGGADPIVRGGALVFDMTAVAPVTAAFVRPVVLFGDVDPAYTAPANGRNVFIFDATLNAVPEPAAGAALGIIGGLMALRRR